MKLSPLLFLALFSMAGTCGKQTTGVSPLPWDQGRSSLDLKVFSQAPHPMGSPRIAFLADYLEKQMQTVGLETFRDRWDATVPDPEAMSGEINPMRSLTLTIPMQNVYAKLKKGSDSCVYLVASHYDSKRLETGDGIGANDSGSSSVAVLELMRALKASDISLRCHIMAVWFDGEEAYLPDWRDGEIRHPARRVDNTYGSRHLADSLKTCGKNFCLPDAWGGEKIEGMILLDMVGMPDLRLTRETRSTPSLLETAERLDKELFQGKLFSRSRASAVEDDHIAFLDKGIPALDLIGFENVETWHQPTDTFETVSMQSIEDSGRLTAALLQTLLAP